MDDGFVRRPALSVVVPVYRSAQILPQLVQSTRAALEGAGLQGEFELIFVCDASPDSSWQVIRTLATENAFVRGICLRLNAGQHNATMAGLHHARGRSIVVMDDDLQHPPEAIPLLLARLNEGFDVCYTRYHNRRHALWKKAGSWINDAVATALLAKPRGLYLSSFKAMRREIAEEVTRYDGPYAYVDGLILDTTRSIATVEIEHGQRMAGRGNYNLRRSMSLWLKMATSFSVAPLRLASMLGAILGLLSLCIIAYVVWVKLHDPTIPAGWASLIATVLFVGGAQLVGLGLIGEYLGRAYIKLNRKPQFVIREATDDLALPASNPPGGLGEQHERDRRHVETQDRWRARQESNL
jgi:undecaprenyl-phosphate 4-deoxy-4-formamido-L-arabinose transferase